VATAIVPEPLLAAISVGDMMGTLTRVIVMTALQPAGSFVGLIVPSVPRK
jgi:hypothetical protein